MTVLYLQRTPKTDGPSDAGEMGYQGEGLACPMATPSCLLPFLAAQSVRVVIIDCSGVTFADAAGAREVVQVRVGGRGKFLQR